MYPSIVVDENTTLGCVSVSRVRCCHGNCRWGLPAAFGDVVFTVTLGGIEPNVPIGRSSVRLILTSYVFVSRSSAVGV